MAPRYWHRALNGDFEEITDNVRLYTLDVTTNAEEAQAALSTLVVDDPDGSLDIGAFRGFFITEEEVASASNQRIYTGYTADRKVARGPYRNGVGRQWTVTLADVNSVLEREVLRAGGGNRPAETDVQRITWVEQTGAGGLIDDTLYLLTGDPESMDKVDYRGQRFMDVVNDCMQQSGKNAFVWVRELGGGSVDFSLWYGHDDGPEFSSLLRLTNDLDDLGDEFTFAVVNDVTELNRDPSRVYSGVYLQYDGGAVYEHDDAIEAQFALGGRDAVAPAENVKSEAKARRRARRMLGDMDTEQDVITTAFYVPATHVNHLMAGQRVQFKATHLPDYESFVWMRCLNRNVKHVSEGPTGQPAYLITVELGNPSGAVAESAVTVNCGEYDNTAGGTYQNLGGRITNDDAVVYYLRAGISRPAVPTPGFVGNWHFPAYGGSVDYAGDGTSNEVMFILVGANGGTLTINTANYTVQEYFRVKRLDYDGGFSTTVLADTQPAGTPYVVNVDWTDAENCIAYVAIDQFGQNPDTGSKLGFDSVVWAPN